FLLLPPPPPRPPRFPYTTLFRSRGATSAHGCRTRPPPVRRDRGGAPGPHAAARPPASTPRSSRSTSRWRRPRRRTTTRRGPGGPDRKSTRLNSSHQIISYAVFCL